MPTPVGHALGGLATGWISRAIAGPEVAPASRGESSRLLGASVLAATVADVDILFQNHRTYAHSVGAAIAAGIVAWAIARWRPRLTNTDGSIRARPSLVGVTIAAAYATHVLFDWLGQDTAPPLGLMALWPFSSQFYISGVNLFMEISRRYWKPDEFILGNVKAAAWELLILGPIAALAWRLAARTSKTRPTGFWF